MVGQEPVLFRGTIHDNISIGCPEVAREDVIKAATMAYAHEFITNLPNVSLDFTKMYWLGQFILIAGQHNIAFLLSYLMFNY